MKHYKCKSCYNKYKTSIYSKLCYAKQELEEINHRYESIEYLKKNIFRI